MNDLKPKVSVTSPLPRTSKLDAAYHTVINWHRSGMCFFVGPMTRVNLKGIVIQPIVELRNFVRLHGVMVLGKLAQHQRLRFRTDRTHLQLGYRTNSNVCVMFRGQSGEIKRYPRRCQRCLLLVCTKVINYIKLLECKEDKIAWTV